MSSSITELKEKYKEAKVLYDIQKFDESNKMLEAIYKSTIAASDKKFVGEVMSLMGNNNFYLGNYDEALQQYLEVEKIFKELKLIIGLSEAASNLGALYKRMGLYGHALLKQLETLTYAFQANEEYIIAISLMHLAAVLMETGHTDKAFRALDSAMFFCDKNKGNLQYENLRTVIINNRATFCATLRRFDEMLKLLHQAKAIAVKYSLKNMYDLIDSNLAMCLSRLKRYEEAYPLLKTLIKKRKNIQDDQLVADWIKIGIVYKEYFKEEEHFLEYLNKAFKLAEKKNLITRQMFICKALRDHYQENGNTVLTTVWDKKLKIFEEQAALNKQTGGMEKLFDTNMLAVENMLRKNEQKAEFFANYEYLTGFYSYTHHGVTRHIPLRDIAYCEVRSNYMYIYTFAKNQEGKLVLEQGHKVRKTMKEFVSEISASKAFFARIHNSFIINLYWLPKDSMNSGNSITIGGKELAISDTYRSAFKKKLNAFLKQEIAIHHAEVG